MPPHVLLVSDQLEVQQAFFRAVGECELTLIVARTLGEAESALKRGGISLIFCPDEMPKHDIERLIRQDRQPDSNVPVIVFSRLDDWENYLKFLRTGAFDYVLYPPGGREFERVVRQALVHSDKAKHTRAVPAA